MAVGIQLGSIIDEVGTDDFFHAFFSTIAANLEPGGWGTRFPVIMKTFYAGSLTQPDAAAALAELVTIRRELSLLFPAKIVWDYEDRSKQPPWGNAIAKEITNLSNYFVTSTGRDLFSSLQEIFEELIQDGGVVTIVKL